MADGEGTQLDRIEKNIYAINQHLRDMNSKIARHEQTLYGPHGRSGIEKDVSEIKKAMPVPGVTSTKTMWAAIGSIATVGALIIALIVGLA